MKIEINIPAPIQKVLQILHDAGGKPRLVGGAVRDAIFNIPTADLDVITTFSPQTVIELLINKEILVKDTGIKYGTVTAFAGGHHTQITTLRMDKDCNGRYVTPEFIDDFEADAKRRDFTINAMSYCTFEQRLYDYIGGYDDLIASKVVFIGDPDERIEEDYLRILRFFRFSDRYANGGIDMRSLKSCIKLKSGLLKLSKERILMEMMAIIKSPTCHKILDIMIENEILKKVIPLELATDLLSSINEAAPSALKIDTEVKFAALMHKNKAEILKDLLYELKFSTKAIRNIVALLVFKEKNPKIYELPLKNIKSIWLHLWVDKLDWVQYMVISEFWKSEHFESISELLCKTPPKFPVNGKNIVQKGVEGKAIKQELIRLKNIWIESDFSIDKEELLRLL